MRLALVHGALVCSVLACAPPNAAKPYPTAEPEGAAQPSESDTATQPESDPQGIARYFDREVDLAPFLAGFPYERFHVSLETGRVFFYEIGDAYTLQMLTLPDPGTGAWDLASAQAISDVDWSKRSLWSIHHHATSDSLWLHADAANDEQMNLWTLDLKTQKLEQVTHHDYVYGLGFNEDESRIAYLPRAGKKAPFETCLRIREVASGEEREIVCDKPGLTFTWSDLRFSPDGREVYFNAQVEGDRTRAQLVMVDLEATKPTVKVLTDKKVRRNGADALEGWLGDELLFVANDDGFENLWAYDRTTRKVRQITSFKEDLTSAELAGDLVVGVHRTPAGSTVVLVDPKTSRVIEDKKLPGTAEVRDAHGSRAFISHTAPDVLYQGYEVVRGDKKLGKLREVIALPEALETKIVQCKASTVKIPTFDKDPKTGKARQLHAFLLEPREPIADDAHELALITAFYGGANRYSVYDQIMCAAGLTIVSPSVRGSTGFGKAFYSLNDKDLGGDEIIDLFYVARWLEKRAGLPARRIGVYGGSHGGYATMRALTFPPETNGRGEFYPFGFGLAHAGFSDIKTFYDATNIPDWVVLESGDPKKPPELARMKDRSPLTHVNRLQAPLLLTHGSQDWRVPVQESRQFADAAKAQKRPVNYVEIEGQGHHIEGLALQVRTYQARFDFLMAVAKAAPESSE
jgi:dipeptidyl aminopeptidase/acylaminoacyl peptidase